MELIRHIEDARLSLFQSLVDRVARRRRGSDERPSLDDPLVLAGTLYAEMKHRGQRVPAEPPAELTAQVGGAAGTTAWRCVRLAGDLMLARLDGDHARADVIEGEIKDSECDPCWAETITEYLGYFGPDGRKRAIPYVRFQQLDDFVYDVLPPDATVALLGDWGTGMSPAVRLLEQLARHEPDALVHLGDIYYAGTSGEVQQHFVDLVNRILDRARTRMPVYAIPGNHEMYSGGAAFYGMLSTLNAPPYTEAAATQKASYFSLRTTDGAWQLLAMDTAFHDHDPFEVTNGMTYLEPDELQWQLDKLERVHAQGGKTLLLSHHQLFSPFATIGRPPTKPADQQAYNTNLLNSFREVLQAGKVAGWFWGHEHNLAIYEPYGPLARGRCIGHGAVPVLASQQPYKVIAGLSDPPQLVRDPQTGQPIELVTNPDGVFGIGYVIVRLRSADRTAEVSYYVLDGDGPIYKETLA
jgi:hypothetical protein